MALLVLDIQHAGKPGRDELGASHDLNGDGVVEQWEHEAKLTPIYAQAATEVVQAAGHRVVLETKGHYYERHARAVKHAQHKAQRVAYVACHLNAGGGDYGLVCWDYRSTGGSLLAAAILAEMRSEFTTTELKRLIAVDRSACAPSSRPDGRHGATWDRLPKFEGSVYWPRPYATIKGIYDGPAGCSGVCFEPLFIDEHAALISGDGLQRAGQALGRGAVAWLEAG